MSSSGAIEAVFSSETVPRGYDARCRVDERSEKGSGLGGIISEHVRFQHQHCQSWRRTRPCQRGPANGIIVKKKMSLIGLCTHRIDGDRMRHSTVCGCDEVLLSLVCNCFL